MINLWSFGDRYGEYVSVKIHQAGLTSEVNSLMWLITPQIIVIHSLLQCTFFPTGYNIIRNYFNETSEGTAYIHDNAVALSESLTLTCDGEDRIGFGGMFEIQINDNVGKEVDKFFVFQDSSTGPKTTVIEEYRSLLTRGGFIAAWLVHASSAWVRKDFGTEIYLGLHGVINIL